MSGFEDYQEEALKFPQEIPLLVNRHADSLGNRTTKAKKERTPTFKRPSPT